MPNKPQCELILALPIDLPAPPLRSRIASFSNDKGIWTQLLNERSRSEKPWCAMLLKYARFAAQMPEWTAPVELLEEYEARLLELGFLVYAEGELTAIRELCRVNQIACSL